MAIKDLFIKSDEPAAPQQVQSVNPQIPTGIVNIPVSTPVATPVSSSISSDEKIIDTIWNKIISENRPGPDYLELKNNVEALNDLPISDDQKIIPNVGAGVGYDTDDFYKKLTSSHKVEIKVLSLMEKN